MNDIFTELNGMFDEAIENADKETLGSKLQKQRESMGLKAVDIARASGVSESLINKLEANKLTDIRLSTMKVLCMTYNIGPTIFIEHLGHSLEFNQETISKNTHAILKARSLLNKKNQIDQLKKKSNSESETLESLLKNLK